MHGPSFHCSNPDYQRYKASVPPLIPWVPYIYRLTPYPLKLIFCCEFPFYRAEPQPQKETEEGVVKQQPTEVVDETTPITVP